MKAVIKTGGKQYLVGENDVLVVDKLPEAEAAKVTFNEVLLTADDEGKTVTLGTPTVAEAKVEAEVVQQFKDDKLRVFKMRRRKRYRKSMGHRQDLTKIKIVSITA
ncbi:TPA: 50S ribosomal protein L21 [Patescibacteria group bacterium]|nr:50S ribosomal protein L21 [Patescibacteria group bacterium]HCR42253.1 50S ribosomal protein L21 [Patescibacteria group bacterium]